MRMIYVQGNNTLQQQQNGSIRWNVADSQMDIIDIPFYTRMSYVVCIAEIELRGQTVALNGPNWTRPEWVKYWIVAFNAEKKELRSKILI